jgi:hypothetical protein
MPCRKTSLGEEATLSRKNLDFLGRALREKYEILQTSPECLADLVRQIEQVNEANPPRQ